ncbi:MAG: hypothetical protein CVT89_04595 [Candidatus Altiarchaeales archaeon HGW-Altiarchaeales-2]|nr:MAG: hypothetical protein CVT89_04595 [Candidatus Altiarchaeales archaeon HGW-Altiarchaeales-2]
MYSFSAHAKSSKNSFGSFQNFTNFEISERFSGLSRKYTIFKTAEVLKRHEQSEWNDVSVSEVKFYFLHFKFYFKCPSETRSFYFTF